MAYLKSLTIINAVIVATILVLTALIVVRRGILHSLLWIAAIALVVVGAVNRLSYGAGG